MVLEVAIVKCMPGTADDFEKAVPESLAVLARAAGCRGATAHRCVERPDEFVLLVRWTSVDAHLAFRANQAEFSRYRVPIAGFFDGPPSFAHYSAGAEAPSS